MEYITGALLLVPDALSRRPDFRDKDVREGLREAGVLDPVSDLPTNPLSTLDTEEFFEVMPPPSRPSWAEEIDSWLAAVDTLVEAEEAALNATDALPPLRGPVHSANTAPGKIPSLATPTTGKGSSPTTQPSPVYPTESQPVSAPPHSVDEGGSLPSQQPPLQTTPTQPAATGAESPPGQISQRAPAARQRAATGKWVKKESTLPANRQYWRMRKDFFDKYQRHLGTKFDVDACCDHGGQNRMVDRYWSDCLNESWQGLHVWYHITSSHLAIEEVLKKYVEEWRKDPTGTSAVFVLPDLQSHLPQWHKVFRMAVMQIMDVVPTHDGQGEPVQFFESSDGRLHDLLWPVLVVYARPSRPR
ncbi:hypothetical protein CYMTET_33856, partial [Cymbomonas tetramitiformis]